MKNNPFGTALIWVGAIVFALGCIVGLTPQEICGSAWFPETCMPGVHASSMGTSMVLLLVGAAAGIAGMVLAGQAHSAKSRSSKQ